MQVAELNHVALHVRDVEKSCQFYRQALGLIDLPRPGFTFPGAWFRIGVSQELHLIGRNGDNPPPPRERHFALLVDDLDSYAAHLRQMGIECSGPKPRPDGAGQIFLADPDGHIIELCSSPQPAVPERNFAGNTLAEHRQFLLDLVAIQLCHLWWHLKRQSGEDFATAIQTRVDILRKTDIYPGQSKLDSTPRNFHDPRWLALQAQLHEWFLRCRDDSGPERFEAQALALLEPRVNARAPRDFCEGALLETFQCGSLRFDPPAAAHPGVVEMHMANALAPRSFFADPQHLPACLLDLIAKARARHGATAVETKSWLNSVPQWLALFPQQWQDNLSPPEDLGGSSLAHWGQFHNARGLFNHKHGQLLRQNHGRFPFACRSSWCSLEKLEAHLRALGRR